MDIFHFNMALIELRSMILFAEEKGKCVAAARLFVSVFCSTKQKGKNKCTAAVLRKLTSGAKEIKLDRGSPLRRYFSACSTLWLSHDMYHARASDPIQMKNE